MKKIDLGNGQTIEMREPKVRDMMAVSHITDPVDREVALFVNLTEMNQEEIADLPWATYQEMQEAFKGFGYTKSSI